MSRLSSKCSHRRFIYIPHRSPHSRVEGAACISTLAGMEGHCGEGEKRALVNEARMIMDVWICFREEQAMLLGLGTEIPWSGLGEWKLSSHHGVNKVGKFLSRKDIAFSVLRCI